ncbi:MAG: hypothetical protein GY861_14510 [bacterium]|nr:hypothetical protein [bacterium]
MKDIRRKATKAMKIAREKGLSQGYVCMKMGVSIPTLREVIQNGNLPLNPKKKNSIKRWIKKQLGL